MSADPTDRVAFIHAALPRVIQVGMSAGLHIIYILIITTLMLFSSLHSG